MHDSKISVVLPVRNGALYIPYISELISNSCGQSDEIIVLSDGSQDQSLAKLKIWAQQDSRVNLVDTGGIGLVNSLNLGLKLASNEWVARYDVDDKYDVLRLKIQRGLLTDDIAAVFSDYQFRTLRGVTLGRVYSAIHPTETAMSLISGARTPHPAVIFNRRIALAVGGYRTEDFPAEDLSLWMRMSLYGSLISAPHELLKYTLNNKSVTSIQQDNSRQKRRELVSNFVKSNFHGAEYLNNLSETRNKYESDVQGELRYLLHLKDLGTIENILGNDQVRSNAIKRELTKTLMRVNNIPKVTTMFISKALRDAYRQLSRYL